MGVYWDYPTGWNLVLALEYGCLLTLYLLRKNKKKGDFKIRLKYGLVSLIAGFILEFVGVSLKLWTLLPGNWPITVWISYFGLGLFIFEFNGLFKEWKTKQK